MITKTYTYAQFFFSESPDFEYIKKLGNDLDSFTESVENVNLESFLKDLLSQKTRLVTEGVTRIALFHTLFYDFQCNTEFSPKIISLINDLGATFCVSTELDAGNSPKVKFYDLIENLKKRPAMYLGKASITLLEAFLNGYGVFNEQIDYGQPSFDGFNDFVGKFYGKHTTAGWKNLILADHYGNEEEALDRFFVLLDEYQQNSSKPNARAIILRLLHVAMLDFRAEDQHQRQSQIADLLHHVSQQLNEAIHGGISVWYDNILQDIFERVNGNPYLHNWIKANVITTQAFEYELWSGVNDKVVITTVLSSSHAQKELILDPCEKLIKTFFAINNAKANETKEAFQLELTKLENQKKEIESHDLSFFTEYYQFYILDSETKAQTDASDFWNNEADKRKLAIGKGLLGVTVAKYAVIDVKIKVLSAEPSPDFYADHIVETPLKVPSGRILIQNCTTSETQLTLDLDKGTYRVRISSFNLWTVKNDQGDDYYLVEIWKSKQAKTALLKDFADQ